MRKGSSTREAITQAEQAHLRREKRVVSAIPAADRRASDEDKESAERPMLVV
jgi:hypothetical protein